MPEDRYRFGLFEFDGDTLRLQRQGVTIHLQSQPSRVLLALLQQSQRVVSRESLKQTVWGSSTFVDFERGLNFCVSQLRSALHDDAARPVYIRTIPKQGYQFIAPVEHMGAPAQTSPPSAVQVPPTLTRRLTFASFILAILIASGLLGVHFFKRRRPSLSPPVIAVVRFDNETGDPTLTRFSDALTDAVVERLTILAGGRYLVIGNSRILRLPRDQRDLAVIASDLHANFIILGQLQNNGSETRILAHLIKMPAQTHLWVARSDRPLADQLAQETETAEAVAEQLSSRLGAPPLANSSPLATPK